VRHATLAACLLVGCTPAMPFASPPPASTAVSSSSSPSLPVGAAPLATPSPSASPHAAVVASIPLGSDGRSSALALVFAPVHRWLYIRTERGVTLLDGDSLKTLAWLDLPGYPGVGLAVDEARYVYVTTVDGYIHALALDLSREVNAFKVGDLVGLNSVAVDHRTHTVYALASGVLPSRVSPYPPRHGAIGVVNPDRGTLEATIDVPGYPSDLGVSSATSRVYVSGSEGPGRSGFVQVIDGDAWREIAVIGITPGGGMALDERDGALYVATTGSPAFGIPGRITFVDRRTNRALTFVSEDPVVLGLDETRHHIYLAEARGELAIGVTNSDHGNPGLFAERVKIPRPISIAVDPARHRVFVGSAGAIAWVTVIADNFPPL